MLRVQSTGACAETRTEHSASLHMYKLLTTSWCTQLFGPHFALCRDFPCYSSHSTLTSMVFVSCYVTSGFLKNLLAFSTTALQIPTVHFSQHKCHSTVVENCCSRQPSDVAEGRQGFPMLHIATTGPITQPTLTTYWGEQFKVLWSLDPPQKSLWDIKTNSFHFPSSYLQIERELHIFFKKGTMCKKNLPHKTLKIREPGRWETIQSSGWHCGSQKFHHNTGCCHWRHQACDVAESW